MPRSCPPPLRRLLLAGAPCSPGPQLCPPGQLFPPSAGASSCGSLAPAASPSRRLVATRTPACLRRLRCLTSRPPVGGLPGVPPGRGRRAGTQSADPAKGGAAVARLGTGSLRSAAGQPGWLSSPQWPSTAPTPTGSARRPARRPWWWLSSPARGSVPAIRPVLVGQAPLPFLPEAPDPWEGVSAPTRHRGSSPLSAWLPGGGPPAGDPLQILATPVSQISHPGWPTCTPPERTPAHVAGTSLCSEFGRRGPTPLVASPATGPALVPAGPRPAPSFGSSFLVATGRSPTSRWGLLPAAMNLGLGFLFASGPPWLWGFPRPPSWVAPRSISGSSVTEGFL